MLSKELQKQLAIEQHSAEAEEFVRRYQELEVDPFRSCFTYSRHRLGKLLEHHLPECADGLRLLDIGCGTGHHMASLRRRGFEVAGADGSKEMVRLARANNPGAEIHQCDVEALPFPNASFDYAICIEVLRYLPDTSGCIREMARVLKPGGICLATATPMFNLNLYYLVNRLALTLPTKSLVRLKQFFTTGRKLRRQFLEAGFCEPRIEGVYFGPINWIERLAPWALPRALRSWEPLDAKLTNAPLLREFSNMFLIRAVRRRR
jgi:ubiquinone/menaquinone biosynthesis C-methylase UbiE